MTDVLNSCPICGMQSGHCRHSTEGQVSIPTRLQPADVSLEHPHRESAAAGGADPDYLAIAAMLCAAEGREVEVVLEFANTLSHGVSIELAAKSALSLLESEGQS